MLCCVAAVLVFSVPSGVSGQMSGSAVGGLRRHRSNEHLFGSVSTSGVACTCGGLGWFSGLCGGRGGGGRREGVGVCLCTGLVQSILS